jgi:DNA-binding Lrp family transcriptional regulator
MTKNSKGLIEQDEKKVLSELVKNSKGNIDTIAKLCGFSRQKTWRIIKKLEQNGLIWGYTTVFDEKKLDLIHFILLVKRSTLQAEITDVDMIVSKKTEELAKEYGIMIETSAYIHGEYDWIMTFTAKDIKEAKNFSNKLVALYPKFIEKMTIMQTLIFMRNHYILNPDRALLKDFL